jgi:DNA-binding transcriptional regulator GbsR (MarR family)
MNSLKKIEKLKSEIEKLKGKIKEKESSLPAHSIRPEMIQELEGLEEELNKKRKILEKILV